MSIVVQNFAEDALLHCPKLSNLYAQVLKVFHGRNSKFGRYAISMDSLEKEINLWNKGIIEKDSSSESTDYCFLEMRKCPINTGIHMIPITSWNITANKQLIVFRGTIQYVNKKIEDSKNKILRMFRKRQCKK